jgi:hypothetical protein
MIDEATYTAVAESSGLADEDILRESLDSQSEVGTVAEPGAFDERQSAAWFDNVAGLEGVPVASKGNALMRNTDSPPKLHPTLARVRGGEVHAAAQSRTPRK